MSDERVQELEQRVAKLEGLLQGVLPALLANVKLNSERLEALKLVYDIRLDMLGGLVTAEEANARLAEVAKRFEVASDER